MTQTLLIHLAKQTEFNQKENYGLEEEIFVNKSNTQPKSSNLSIKS